MAWLCGRCADLRMAAAVDWEEDQMKFHDPETGEVVSIPVAVSRYCKTKGRWCCKCSLPGAMNQSEKPCEPWAEAHPHEAARLMGFEVVEDEQFREVTKMMKEANMDKPLKDWTLGEVKIYCEKTEACKGCPCSNEDGTCKINRVTPCNWDLSERTRWTEQEVESAKIISVLFPEATHIERLRGSKVLGITGAEDGWIADIESSLFPEIKSGQSVTLDEIIGGAQ